MRIRDRGWRQFGPGMEKSRIRDKHPGSATLTQTILTKLSKIWVWDPGSGKKPIPDPGARGQKGTGSRIRIRNTVWITVFLEPLKPDP
jgi:hypothetical protein